MKHEIIPHFLDNLNISKIAPLEITSQQVMLHCPDVHAQK